MTSRSRPPNGSSKLCGDHPAKARNRGGRDADYRRGLTYATTDGCDVERRDGRGNRKDPAARGRFGARVLLDSPTSDSGGDRSHWFDAVVPGVDGRAGDRLRGGPSSEDPRGRTAETKARSKRCRAGVAVAG